MTTAIDQMNAAMDALDTEVKLDTALLDELAGMVRNAGPGGSLPADQVAALISRVNTDTGALGAARTADTPAAAPATPANAPVVDPANPTGAPPATSGP